VVSNAVQRSFGEVYRTIFMLANVHHRTVTITIITNCTQFIKPRYIIVKIDLYKDNGCSTLIFILVYVLVTFVVNVIIAYRMVSRTQSQNCNNCTCLPSSSNMVLHRNSLASR